ncbi:MAG: ABC transporter permease [Gemmatales bacterium]|nr:ABC transporter permease [Gemmatales bacterium]MDW8386489.1 ABC transporter permease [Gemmatales bacterium]
MNNSGKDSVMEAAEGEEQRIGMEAPSQPSLEEEKEPKAARTAGVVGLFFLLFGLFMLLWNWAHQAYEWANKGWPWSVRFSVPLIAVWLVLGCGSTLFHAFQDRDRSVRRGYGFVAYMLLLFGSVVTVVSLSLAWLGGLQLQPDWLPRLLAGLIGGAVGLILVGSATAGFVGAAIGNPPAELGWKDLIRWKLSYPARWLTGMRTNSRVQQATLAGIFAAGVFLATALLAPGINLLPYSMAALALGFVYLLPFTANETESDWREGAANIYGAIGWAAALFTLASSFLDLFGVPSFAVPYGAAAVFLGFPFLAAYIGAKGADSDDGYWTSRAVAYLGIVLILIAGVRSIAPLVADLVSEGARAQGYFLPAGFFLMLIGGIYLLTGATLASDSRLLVMMRKELAALLGPSLGWVVLAGMAGMAGFSFYLFISFLVPDDPFAVGRGQLVAEEPIIQNYFLEFIPLVCLILLVPLLTMRMLSEENRTGTLEVLLAAPVTEWEIVLSKFLAVWIFNMIAWSLWAVFPFTLWIYSGEPFDYRPMLSFYVGIGAMTAGFLAMGLFFSSITPNQIVAALLTSVVMIVLTIIVIFMFQLMNDPAASQTKREALGYVSYYHHLMEFVRGRVHLRFVLFHLSLAAFWLFLTVKVLEARKWR